MKKRVVLRILITVFPAPAKADPLHKLFNFFIRNLINFSTQLLKTKNGKVILTIMVIVVNTCSFAQALSEEQTYFINKMLSIVSQQYPQHQYHVISYRAYEVQSSKGISFFTVKKPSLFSQWQIKRQIKRFLKKIKADVLVAYPSSCIAGVAVPQCIVVNNLTSVTSKTAKCLTAAKSVAALTDTIKINLTGKYKISPEKIVTINKGIKEHFQPTADEQQQEMKNQYTGGKEYFIYAGAVHPDNNIITLLKAFSLFKKRQKTSMKLVLAGTLQWEPATFTQLLNTYKYREDVVLITHLPEQDVANVLSAAYAFIQPSVYAPLNSNVEEAMYCGVPVLVADDEGMKEAAGDAGLFFDATQITDIANKMTQMYIDENLRRQLIEKGKRKMAGMTWQRTAGLLWQCVEMAVK